MGFAQIKRSKNLSEEVASNIKESILNGEYEPGDSLPSENQMTLQFGVSRVVVREALKELKSSGLIEIRRGPKGGSFVCKLDKLNFGEQFSNMVRLRIMTVEHLFSARLLIEPEIIRLVLKNITDDQVEMLHRLADQARTETNREKRRDLNMEFHHQLGMMSGNAFYALFIDSSLDFVGRFLSVITPDALDVHDNTSHGEIAQAIFDKDEIKAITLMRSHLINIRDEMIVRENDYITYNN
jgi:GntR family transcriptional regulator, transcriptional repressor for pyruvate dehydrogenase complex